MTRLEKSNGIGKPGGYCMKAFTSQAGKGFAVTVMFFFFSFSLWDWTHSCLRTEGKGELCCGAPEMFYSPASLHSVFTLNYRKPQCTALYHTETSESGREKKNPLHILHTWGGGRLDISTLPPICRNRHLQNVLGGVIHVWRKRLKGRRRGGGGELEKKNPSSRWLNAVIICLFTSDIFS